MKNLLIIICILIAPTYFLAQNPSAYIYGLDLGNYTSLWPFWVTGNGTDIIGGNTGTAGTGVTWTVGTGATCTGTGAITMAGGGTTLRDFGASGVFQMAAAGHANYASIIGKLGGGPGKGWGFNTNSTGDQMIFTTPGSTIVSTASPLEESGYYHGAISISAGSTATVSIYINGTLAAVTTTTDALTGATGPFSICDDGSGADFWQGNVVSMSLWNHAPTQAEIQYEYTKYRENLPQIPFIDLNAGKPTFVMTAYTHTSNYLFRLLATPFSSAGTSAYLSYTGCTSNCGLLGWDANLNGVATFNTPFCGTGLTVHDPVPVWYQGIGYIFSGTTGVNASLVTTPDLLTCLTQTTITPPSYMNVTFIGAPKPARNFAIVNPSGGIWYDDGSTGPYETFYSPQSCGVSGAADDIYLMVPATYQSVTQTWSVSHEYCLVSITNDDWIDGNLMLAGTTWYLWAKDNTTGYLSLFSLGSSPTGTPTLIYSLTSIGKGESESLINCVIDTNVCGGNNWTIFFNRLPDQQMNYSVNTTGLGSNTWGSPAAIFGGNPFSQAGYSAAGAYVTVVGR